MGDLTFRMMLRGDALDIGERQDVVAGTVQAWLGNLASRTLLKLVTGRTEHGNRLDLALRDYLGGEIPERLGFRSKLASLLVSFIVERGSRLFGVTPERMRKSLGDPAGYSQCP